MSRFRSWGTALAAMTLALAAGEAAFAQADLRALRQRNELLQQQDIARQNLLAAQREASAAQGRYQAQQAVRPLDSTPSALARAPVLPAPPATPLRGLTTPDYAAEAQRLERLTDQSLAQGNARLRAITPAQ
jgi:hypothetical protein